MLRRWFIAGLLAVALLAAVLALHSTGFLRRPGTVPLTAVRPHYREGSGGAALFQLAEGEILRITSDTGEYTLCCGRDMELKVVRTSESGIETVAHTPAGASAAIIFKDKTWELISSGKRLTIDGRIVSAKSRSPDTGLRYLPASRPEPVADDFMRQGDDAAPWTLLSGEWFLTAGADPLRSANPFSLAYGSKHWLRPDPMLAERTERERIGIGVAVGDWRGRDFVSRLSAQGPAARAGVEEEDIVLSADGLASRYGRFGNTRRNSVRMTVFRPSTAQILKFDIRKEPYKWGEVRFPIPLAGSLTNNTGLMVVGQPQWCEGEAAVSVRPGASGAGGLAWRVMDGDAFLAARLAGALFDKGRARLEVVQFDKGLANRIAEAQIPVWPEAFYRLASRLDGDRLTVSMDGTRLIECEVPAGIGRPGLCAWTSEADRPSPAPVLFDDFEYHGIGYETKSMSQPRESRSTVMTREEAMIEWAAARGEWRRSGDFFFYLYPLYRDFEVEVGDDRRVLIFDEGTDAWSKKSFEPSEALLEAGPPGKGEMGALVVRQNDEKWPLCHKVGGRGFKLTATDSRVDVRLPKGAGGPGGVLEPLPCNWFGLAVERLPDESAYPKNVTVMDEGAWDTRFEKAPSDLLFLSGFWGIANKWVCDPRFSWLAARSSEVAQAWWKGRLAGDFTLDFYTATFMELNDEPFERNGDLGVALSARPGDLGDGYFLSIGEEYDTASRFYRRGKVLAETRDERFLPPSNHLYLPLRQEFHRRWTHIRLSRRGKRFTYEIDGRRALSVEDTEALDVPYLALMCQRTGFLISRMRLSGDIEPGIPPETAPLPCRLYDDGEFTNLWAGVPQTQAVHTKEGLEVEQVCSGPMLLVHKTPFVLRSSTLLVRLKPLRGDLRLGVYILPNDPPTFHWGEEYGDGTPTRRDELPPGPPFSTYRPRLFDQGLLLYVPLVGEFPENSPFTKARDIEHRILPDGTIEVTARLDLPYPTAHYALRAQGTAAVGMLHLDEYAVSGVKYNRPGSAYLLKCLEVVPDPVGRPRVSADDQRDGWRTALFLINGTAPKRWNGGTYVDAPGRLEEGVLLSQRGAPFLTPTRWAGRTRLYLEQDWSPPDFPILELTYRADTRVALSPYFWPPGASLIWGDGLDDRTEWAIRAGFTEPLPAEELQSDGETHTAHFNLFRTLAEGLKSQHPQGGMVSLCDEGWRGMYPGIGMELHGFGFIPMVSSRLIQIVPSSEAARGEWRMSVDTSPKSEPLTPSVILPETGTLVPFQRLLLEAYGIRVVSPDSLREGRNYVHFKARSADGRWGETEHWPFLVDTEPPEVRFLPAPPGDNSLLFGSFEVQDPMGIVPSALRVTAKDAVGRWYSYTDASGLRWEPHTGRLSLVRAVPPPWISSPVEVTLSGIVDTLSHQAPDFGPLEIWPHGSVTLEADRERKDVPLREACRLESAGPEPAVFFVPEGRGDAMAFAAPARVMSLIGGANYFEETLGQLRPCYNVEVKRTAGAGLGGGHGGRILAWPGEWRTELLQRYIDPRNEQFFVMSYRVEGNIEQLHIKVQAVGDRWAVYPIDDISPGWHTVAIDLQSALDEKARSAMFPYVLRADLVGECGGRFDPLEPAGRVYLDALGAAGTLRLRLACAPGHERIQAFHRLANDKAELAAAKTGPLRIGIHHCPSLPGRFMEVLVRPVSATGEAEMTSAAVVDLRPLKAARFEDKW